MLFVCVDVLRPSQKNSVMVGRFSCLPGLKKDSAEYKVSCSRTQILMQYLQRVSKSQPFNPETNTLPSEPQLPSNLHWAVRLGNACQWTIFRLRQNLPSISVAQFPIFSFTPGVDLPFRRECQAMFTTRVHRYLLDKHMLYGLEEGGGWYRLCPSNA